MIYLFTGNGGGKTIAALGLALRSIGHKHKVVVIQFMKGRKDVGEYKAAKRLFPCLKLYQFGREEFVNLRHPAEEDKKLAKAGFEFAKKALKKKPNLLILDEISLAIAIKLLDLKDVLSFLKGIPKTTDVVLTGRRASRKLYKIANGVSVIKKVKHVFDKGVSARKGIEY
jgi:cob(I)alamin adenosyltransferase